VRQTVKVTSAPAAEPVSLTDAKTYLRVDGTDDDNLITALIQTARMEAEAYTRRAFISQTLELHADRFPVERMPWWDGVREGVPNEPQRDHIELPRPPLIGVESVTYNDTSDTSNTFAASNYFVDTGSEPGRVVLSFGKQWPTNVRATAGVVVAYTAGYGPSATEVPRAIRDAILRVVAHLYEHRADYVVGTIVGKFPMTAQTMLDPYRVLRL
jgi:uncharacterized phiE125 gp8 family phage protein